ncbi:MAG: PKD domain-containing protein [Bacteroidales bacterium]|nr:PKD domain-containing protein [Bacteroidales bacterium]
MLAKRLLILAAIAAAVSTLSFAQNVPVTVDKYITSRSYDESGREIISVTTPVKPPSGYRAPAAEYTANAVVLAGVPAFSWSFGCSPTAASMGAGFYDNNGYPSAYTGPANGGVMPMNNSNWGSVVINGETRDLCPLSATMLNLDGRTTRGHVDDYWTLYNSSDPDPYIINGWAQHLHGDCLADFMGTNQSAVGSSDGSTTFFYYGDGSPIYDYSSSEPGARDGCHGMRLFYESRGITVVQNYTQLIYGNGGNTLGFTFAQYMNEIDNGRPVLIQVSGHTMLGYGYDETGSIVYLHDTWDYLDHSMVWGGEYAGMAQWGVTVLQLFAANAPPIANFSGTPNSILTGESVNFSDISAGNPTSWQWTFEGGTPSASSVENPVVSYFTPGVYDVTLVATNANGSDTETKSGYITVEDPDYCDASATCDEFIGTMNFNTISNTSSCGTNGYTDFTGISTTLTAGISYTISVTTSPWYTGDQCGAWVDWNQDLDFDDAGEYFPMSESSLSGTITPPSDALNGPTRLRVRLLYTGEIVPCGNVDWGETEDYTVNVINPESQKILNLTLMLEGLFDPTTQMMRKAGDESGPHFPGTVADQINVSLVQSAPPYSVVASSVNTALNQNGTCMASFSSALSGIYYLKINHRNSIESWSSTPVSFSGNSISYNFSDSPSKIYGNNSILKGGKYCLFGGDANQDGSVDTGDMTPIDNDASAFTSGYVVTDINGDGIVDTGDVTIVDNNGSAFVGSVHP